MIIKKAYCTFTGDTVDFRQFKQHKRKIQDFVGQKYGTLWPIDISDLDTSWGVSIPTISEPAIAKFLGVSKVWIRYEGANQTGSMKDYLVTAAVKQGVKNGSSAFTVVSSGNHAVSLAHYSKEAGKKCVIFVPAKTSKLPILRSFENALVIGVENGDESIVFEDVYKFAQPIRIPCVCNANVNNDFLMAQVASASRQVIESLGSDNLPTHVIAGVGNGSYISGMIFGFDFLGVSGIKAVPVGMRGAFPTEDAFKQKKAYHEYPDFLFGESDISSAEGSIALESYSMPQLMHAINKSNGFPLGGLTDLDIASAYNFFAEKSESFNLGNIPEPTGILSLAAILKHKNVFQKDDRLLLSFTGAGFKNIEDVKTYGGVHSGLLVSKILETQSALPNNSFLNNGEGLIFDNFVPVNKYDSPEKVKEVIMNFLTK